MGVWRGLLRGPHETRASPISVVLEAHSLRPCKDAKHHLCGGGEVEDLGMMRNRLDKTLEDEMETVTKTFVG